jgi:O-antigen ligase
MLKFIYRNNYLAIIFISWLFLWLSLGILPTNLNNKLNTYVDLINTLRVYIPLFFTFSLLLIIFIKYLKIFNHYKKNSLTIVNLFIIYFLFQIIGLYQNSFSEFNIENLYLIILGFCTIEILIINQFLNKNINLEYLLYSAVILCVLSSSYFFFSNFINHPYYSLHDIFGVKIREYYDINLDKKFFLENIIPRSTGISRTFGLINIFIFIYLIFVKNKKNYLLYFISIIYTSLIWLLQSRGSILIFFTTTILIIYLAKKINLKKKILIVLWLLILPIVLSETVLLLGKNFTNSNPTFLFFNKNLNLKKELLENRTLSDHSSSGRIEIWHEALKLFEKNKIFGYGPQGDRFIFKGSEVKDKFYNNSSNALIYSFLSGGYFGILVMFLIYLNIVLKIYICLKKLKIFNNYNQITLKLSVCYIIFFLTRSLFENSFSLFSIDFMIFIVSATYIENYLKTIPAYKLKVLK